MRRKKVRPPHSEDYRLYTDNHRRRDSVSGAFESGLNEKSQKRASAGARLCDRFSADLLKIRSFRHVGHAVDEVRYTLIRRTEKARDGPFASGNVDSRARPRTNRRRARESFYNRGGECERRRAFPLGSAYSRSMPADLGGEHGAGAPLRARVSARK